VIDKLTFFNDYGAGDIHYSREFVKDIMRKIPARLYVYEVRQNFKILKDIDNLILAKPSSDFRIRYVNNRFEINFFEKVDHKDFEIIVKNFDNEILYSNNCKLSYKYTVWIEILYFGIKNFIIEIYEKDFLYHKEILKIDDKYNIETWVGYNDYFKIHNCTLYSNYLMFKEIYRKLGITLDKLDYYLPSINFDKIETDNIDNFLKDKKLITILISNGKVKSEQAANFDFNPIINRLSTTFNDVLFLTTHYTNISSSNIINISDITKMTNDLNEIAYLSTFCDIIVGRGSGPYCFTIVKDNLFNNKITFMAFCENPDDGIYYYGKTQYFEEAKNVRDIECKYVYSSNYDEDSIYNLISFNILEKQEKQEKQEK